MTYGPPNAPALSHLCSRRLQGIPKTLLVVGTYELVFILYDAFFFHVFLSFWLRLLMDCLLLTFIPLLLATPCAHPSDD